MRKKDRKQKGFTLLEVIISVAILSVVVLMGSLVQKRNQQVWFKSNQRRDVQQNARIALDQMVKDIKQAGYIYGNRASTDIPPGIGQAINIAQQNRISFNAVIRDVNGDGLKEDTTTWSVNRDTETVTFSMMPISGTSRKKIQKRSVSAYGVLDMDFTLPQVGVENLEFKYRDESGNVFTFPISGNDRYNIRYIEINLTVKKGAGDKKAAAGYEEITLTSGVSPPNLKQ
ncbi:type II secretion system protein [bacterium]|nr:type II secretion system protein [bacterium]